MTQIPQESTLDAIIKEQRQIKIRCQLQYLKLLKDAYIKSKKEYIEARNKLMM